MEWKCPGCGANNDKTAECSCGYAFYKILGVKPDASPESVKQTYKYLLNLWETDNVSKDPLAKKKADERLKKINDAYKTFLNYASVSAVSEKKTSTVKIALLAGISVLVLVLLFIFLNPFKGDEVMEKATTELTGKPGTKPSSAGQAIVQSKAEEPKSLPPASLPQPEVQPQPLQQVPANINLSERTEENAIGLVKKSHVLDRFFDVDTMMKKWTDDNSGKLQFIGWKTKKIDEQTYLVGYTASDGLVTSGFYFDVDFSTGNVRHLANYPELQKKYDIQYNK